MDFTITIPHSLGVKRAAEKLQGVADDTLLRIETESEGESDGIRRRTTTTITADTVTARVRGEGTNLITRLTPDSIVQRVIENKLRKQLED